MRRLRFSEVNNVFLNLLLVVELDFKFRFFVFKVKVFNFYYMLYFFFFICLVDMNEVGLGRELEMEWLEEDRRCFLDFDVFRF